MSAPEKGQPRILVIKLGALGDFIQALGPMAAIRLHHPDAYITLLTAAPFEDFAKECGYFDDIWVDTKPKLLNITTWLKMKKDLNAADFQRVYDLQNNDRTSIYFRLLSKKNKPEWVGAAKGASHENNAPERTAGHAFDGHVQTLGLAGINDIQIDRLEWMQDSVSMFPTKSPYVLLIPGCAPSRPEKRWPTDKYGRLAKLLLSLGFQPVIIGGPSEKDLAQIILSICPESLDLTGQTSLKQIAVLARNAAGAIGNDTGPMHLIAATTCPSLVLFSAASNPVRHAPQGENVEILQENNLKDLKSEKVIQTFKPRTEPAAKAKTLH